MAELHFAPRDPVKSMPQSYPKPKCDPKKNLIHLTPAAARPVLEEEMSFVFRGGNSPRRLKPSHRHDPTNSSDEDEDEKSLPSDHSTSNSPSIPYARSSPSPYSAPGSPDLPYPRHRPAAPLSPAARNRSAPASRPYGPPAAHHSAGAPRMYPQRGYPGLRASDKGTGMGSTIPRHTGPGAAMCSPAASLGRGNPNAVNKFVGPVQRY